MKHIWRCVKTKCRENIESNPCYENINIRCRIVQNEVILGAHLKTYIQENGDERKYPEGIIVHNPFNLNALLHNQFGLISVT